MTVNPGSHFMSNSPLLATCLSDSGLNLSSIRDSRGGVETGAQSGSWSGRARDGLVWSGADGRGLDAGRERGLPVLL